MQQRGAKQNNWGPMEPGQFRTSLGLEVGQEHPWLCGEARPSRQNPLPSALPYPGLATHLAQPATTIGDHLALEAVSDQPQLSQLSTGSISSPQQMVTFRAANVECTREVFGQLTCLPSIPFFLSSPSGRVKRSSQSSRATWSSHPCPCLCSSPT